MRILLALMMGLIPMNIEAAELKSTRKFADPQADITATFSIVAIDPTSGECGAAVASKYPAVGGVVPHIRAGVGAFCTQHYHHPEWGELALDQLAKGASPIEVITSLLRDDSKPEQRQLALIDMSGRVAVHNPTQAPKSSRYWGAMSGLNYSCQGNTLTGREVILAMSSTFEKTGGTLADRLVAALVAGDQAGGDHRGRLAASVRIAKAGVEGIYFAIDIDDSRDAVMDLAKEYKKIDHPAKSTSEPAD